MRSAIRIRALWRMAYQSVPASRYTNVSKHDMCDCRGGVYLGEKVVRENEYLSAMATVPKYQKVVCGRGCSRIGGKSFGGVVDRRE
jgi:hypothetical protein